MPMSLISATPIPRWLLSSDRTGAISVFSDWHLAIFGWRRIGKTAFLRQDLMSAWVDWRFTPPPACLKTADNGVERIFLYLTTTLV